MDNDKANIEPESVVESDAVESADKPAKGAFSAGFDMNKKASNMAAAQFEGKISELEKKVEESNDNFLRAKAEAENVKRRAQIDVENAHKYGSEKFAKELLLVLDSFEHGLEAGKDLGDDAKGLLEGMVMTKGMLLSAFEKFGITTINPENEKFNPAQHEALAMQESGEVEANTVLNVVQAGFMIYDRVLRPARVIVSKKP